MNKLALPYKQDILPPAKVARIIGTSKQRVAGWMKRGTIDVYLVHGERWVSLDECESMLIN